MNYKYVGGGYYRERGIEKGKVANLIHGAEMLDYVNILQNKLQEYLNRSSSDGAPIRRHMREELKN
jgi:hypothetical protein